ncbi:carbohydrate esterase family 16 protein [Hydnomerulius pinastri MD-312]|uniref:Carbohydrate esterase family 16 protein n=1 Tax=Hydnomerulius pinastri MD-312 TaxID=994086 RepID=A0A0C9WF60_9AGAM|nr:carbohydrate esterase family 16 protein [Hydnomerulius pinastri MD-312]
MAKHFVALLAALGVAASAAAGPSFDWNTIKYFYIFGDSYSFVQGTEGYANYSFIGDAFNLGFTPSQLLSDQIIPHNTSSDGSNWPEFLTGCYSGLPSECPRQLWDFAFAGADISLALLPLHHNFSVQMVDQVKQYVTYAADVIPHPSEETMTAWWIGINDTGDSLQNTTISNFTEFWEQEMTAYFEAVEMAYDNGLNGPQLFFNVPPEERSPAWVNDATWGPIIKEHIDEYNSILATYVQNFADAHPETPVISFDAHSLFNFILDNGEAFGFTNTTGYCECTDPSYFWYNTGHPTQNVHKLIAAALEVQLLSAEIL